jgi:hypothetical protein
MLIGNRRRSVAIEDGKLNGTMEVAHFHTFIYR